MAAMFMNGSLKLCAKKNYTARKKINVKIMHASIDNLGN
jgi:hypothetical protein